MFAIDEIASIYACLSVFSVCVCMHIKRGYCVYSVLFSSLSSLSLFLHLCTYIIFHTPRSIHAFKTTLECECKCGVVLYMRIDARCVRVYKAGMDAWMCVCVQTIFFCYCLAISYFIS